MVLFMVSSVVLILTHCIDWKISSKTQSSGSEACDGTASRDHFSADCSIDANDCALSRRLRRVGSRFSARLNAGDVPGFGFCLELADIALVITDYSERTPYRRERPLSKGAPERT